MEILQDMENLYLPKIFNVKSIVDETEDIKTFTFEQTLNHIPGQFVELSMFGIGEAPLSISTALPNLELTVKRMGAVTNALHNVEVGDVVGIRGPFGNGWPIDDLKDKNVVIVAGGVGLAPLRGVVQNILARRKNYREFHLLYGARTPGDLVFKQDLERWSKEPVNLYMTVDVTDKNWQGNVGVVTTLFPKTTITAKNSIALVCGPGIMMKFVVKSLKDLKFDDDQIIVSMERMMKCGVGKCGHCGMGAKYICLDGPVFTYKQIVNLPTELR